jgi:hypothetical protein
MQLWNVSATFTRPADTNQYAAGDLIANSVTAASVVPMSFPIQGNSMTGQTRITRVRFVKGGTTNTASQFRIHLYGSLPTVANGDNGAWSSSAAANYLGSIDGPSVLKAFTDGCADVGSATAGAEFLIRLPAGKTIYGLLAAIGTYTPDSSEVFTITLEMLDAY